jgi:hypothetical protein
LVSFYCVDRPYPHSSDHRLTTVRTLATLLLMVFAIPSGQADEPAAPGFRPDAVLFKNAKVVLAPGQIIEKAHVLVRHGRISGVGAEIPIPPDAEVIDADGLTILPGFIDAGAAAFLQDAKPQPVAGRAVEISKYALAGMRQDDRNGLTPEFAAGEHLSAKPEDQERYRQAGFVAVHVLPSGRIASGRGTVLNLASLPLRESILVPVSFATMQLSERGGGEYPATNMGVHAHLRQAFLDAERHATQQRLFKANTPNVTRSATDAALDAMNEMRTPAVKTVFVAFSRDDHDRSLNFASEHQLRPVIWGGHEAYRVIDRLKKTETVVIVHVDFGEEPKLDAPKPGDDPYADLADPQRVREHKRNEWKQRVAGLAELQKAGVRFAVSSRDGKSPSDVLKGLRQAIANGLDRDAALASITTQPAAILGLDQELGTIAVGRPAYFTVMTGAFDNDQSKVRHVVINGYRYEYNKEAKPIAPATPGQAAPLQVGGTWTVEIESAEGKVRGELELVQTDRALSGRFKSNQGDGRLSSGKVSAEAVEFVVSIGAGDNIIALKFEGKLNGAAMQGNLKSPFGAATATECRDSIDDD